VGDVVPEVDVLGRMPWMVILVDVLGLDGGSAPPTGPPDLLASGLLSLLLVLAELGGGEAETLDTTDETMERSTGVG
jgi:hypothetical protein